MLENNLEYYSVEKYAISDNHKKRNI